MVTEKYEKSLRISPKPKKKEGIMPSFVEGAKQSKVKPGKSLTPNTHPVKRGK